MTPQAQQFLDQLNSMGPDEMVDLRPKVGNGRLSSYPVRVVREAFECQVEIHKPSCSHLGNQTDRLTDQHAEAYDSFFDRQ